MAFKMKGWSAFTSNGDYDPQTVTRRDPNTDITPQSVETTTSKGANIEHSTGKKTKKKSKLGNILLGALGGTLVAGGIGGVVGAIKGAGGIKNIMSKLKGKNKGGKVWKA